MDVARYSDVIILRMKGLIMETKKVAMAAFAALAMSMAVGAMAGEKLEKSHYLDKIPYGNGYITKLDRLSCSNGTESYRWGDGPDAVKKCEDHAAEYNAHTDMFPPGGNVGGNLGGGDREACLSNPGLTGCGNRR